MSKERKDETTLWQPPVELSEEEEHIVKKIRKAKLFVFLRQHRTAHLPTSTKKQWLGWMGTHPVQPLLFC